MAQADSEELASKWWNSRRVVPLVGCSSWDVRLYRLIALGSLSSCPSPSDGVVGGGCADTAANRGGDGRLSSGVPGADQTPGSTGAIASLSASKVAAPSVGEVTTPLMRQVAALSASEVATQAVSNLKGCLRRTERCPIAERGCDTNDERSHDSFDGRVHRSTVTEIVALLAVEVAALLTSRVAAALVSEGATRSTGEVADPSCWHQLAKPELHRWARSPIRRGAEFRHC